MTSIGVLVTAARCRVRVANILAHQPKKLGTCDFTQERGTAEKGVSSNDHQHYLSPDLEWQ